MNRLLYAGGLTLCEIIVVALSSASYVREVASNYWLYRFLFVVVLIALVAGIVLLFSLVYQIWSRIQDEQVRLSPILAIALLIVPVFNLIWLFVVFPGYASRYNGYVERHDLHAAPRLSVALQVFFVLFLILPLPLLQWIFTYVAVGRLVDAANALPA